MVNAHLFTIIFSLRDWTCAGVPGLPVSALEACAWLTLSCCTFPSPREMTLETPYGADTGQTGTGG